MVQPVHRLDAVLQGLPEQGVVKRRSLHSHNQIYLPYRLRVVLRRWFLHDNPAELLERLRKRIRATVAAVAAVQWGSCIRVPQHFRRETATKLLPLPYSAAERQVHCLNGGEEGGRGDGFEKAPANTLNPLEPVESNDDLEGLPRWRPYLPVVPETARLPDFWRAPQTG